MPVILEMDPDQGIEEEFKKKNDTNFCWQMLRTIAAISQNSFLDCQGTNRDPFDGDVEKLAKHFLKDPSQPKTHPVL